MKTHRPIGQECVSDTQPEVQNTGSDILVEGFSQNMHGNAAIQEHLRRACANPTADEVPSHVGSAIESLSNGGLVGHIYFPTNSDALDCDDEDVLTEISQALIPLQETGASVELTMSGYADYRGSDEHNVALSQRRADRVAHFFDEQVSGVRTHSVAEGETPQDKTMPPVPEERRVDIMLSHERLSSEPDLSECPVVPDYDDHSGELYDESWVVDGEEEALKWGVKGAGVVGQVVGYTAGAMAISTIGSLVSVAASLILSMWSLDSATHHGETLAKLIGCAYGSLAGMLGVAVPQSPLQMRHVGTPHATTAPAMQATTFTTEEELQAQYNLAADQTRAALEASIGEDAALADQVEALRVLLEGGALSAADIDAMLNDIFSAILAGYGETSANPSASVEAMSWHRTLLWGEP